MKMDPYMTKEVKGSVEEVSERLLEILKEDGFGLVTEINMEEKFAEKLDVQMPPYKILGVCNPALGYQTVQAEANIGIFLPCKILLRETGDNTVMVVAMNPLNVMSMLENPELNAPAEKVTKVFQKALEKL